MTKGKFFPYKGSKTYFVAGLIVIYAVLGFVLGYQDLNQMIQLLLGAGGLAGLRAGIAKIK